jgi:hypothetical protein
LIVFNIWTGVYFDVYIYTLGLLILCCGVWLIYMAYVGRLRMPIKDENQTVDNSQPESKEVTAGDHNHDNALRGVVMVEEAVERAA